MDFLEFRKKVIRLTSYSVILCQTDIAGMSDITVVPVLANGVPFVGVVASSETITQLFAVLQSNNFVIDVPFTSAVNAVASVLRSVGMTVSIGVTITFSSGIYTPTGVGIDSNISSILEKQLFITLGNSEEMQVEVPISFQISMYIPTLANELSAIMDLEIASVVTAMAYALPSIAIDAELAISFVEDSLVGVVVSVPASATFQYAPSFTARVIRAIRKIVKTIYALHSSIAIRAELIQYSILSDFDSSTLSQMDGSSLEILKYNL